MSNQDLTPPIPRGSGLDEALFDELAALVRGPVFKPSDTEYVLGIPDRSCRSYSHPTSRFHARSRTFNGKIELLSQVVVSPLDAKDVSAVVKFCTKHQLSPSVRAGGYGIAGWAVAGDVIVDVSMIKDVDIEAPIPTADGVTWTPMKDMPEPGSKGKGRAAAPNPAAIPVSASAAMAVDRTSMKRSREEDSKEEANPPRRGFSYNPWTSFDSASQVMGSFLRGPALPPEEGETPREPPKNKPRFHSPEVDGQVPGQKGSSSGTGGSPATSTAATAAPPQSQKSDPPSQPSVAAPGGGADPFGYISGSIPTSTRLPVYGGVDPPRLAAPPFAPISGHVPGPSSSSSWSTPGISSSPFGFPANASMARPLGPLVPPSAGAGVVPTAPAQPVHSHAYVTFGAGVKQKEVDIYTAEHPLEGTSSVTGRREEGVVPYHIPSYVLSSSVTASHRRH